MKDEERTPLRTVLINFLNHIENLESDKFPDENYDSEFQDLKLFSEGVKGLKQYSCFEGEKEVNRKKNRYKDILPFDLSRVILNEYAGVPGSDYINANYIKGSSGSIAYIASQGPLPNTVNDFWRMVVQCEVQVIVMACNEEEAGKRKCERYWVEEGEDRQFGLVNVKLLKASTVCPDFSVRTMRLKYTNSQSVIEERTVCQLHYVAWPDHGVPTVVQPLLDMVRLLRDTQASETLPVLVHCSAGCGRTGTICAIDYVWGLLRNGKLTKDFSLLSLVRKMRRQRIAMVQTKEQYVLVHQAVRELFKEQLCMIDSHPYENIDSNGMIRMKEEPVYDVVGIMSDVNEEKQDDKKEKEVFLPVLPQKRLTSVLCSKQKKEVQNFTARQKLIDHSDTVRESVPSSPSAMTGSVSKIKKLKSQFEINSEIPITNSVRKLSVISSKNHEVALPIPSRGVLKVPQLECQNSKSSAHIKRSKSLKILSSEERLTICNEIPTDLKHQLKQKSGVDLSMEENGTPWVGPHCKYYGVSKYTTKDTNDSSVCQIVKGYEALSLASNRRPLRRSYTTLDMRQKPFSHKHSQTAGIGISIDTTDVPNKNKSNLSRSHTQLELWKLANKTSSQKESDLFNKKPYIYSSKQGPCENSSDSCQKLTVVELAFSPEASYMNERTCNVVQVPNKRVYKSANMAGPERTVDRFQQISLRTPKPVKDVIKKNEPIKPFDVRSEETSSGLCDSLFTLDECLLKSSSFPQVLSPMIPVVASDIQSHYVNVSRSMSDAKKTIKCSKPENLTMPSPLQTPMKIKYTDHMAHWKHQPQVCFSNSDKEKTGNPNRIIQDPIYINTNFSEVTVRNSPKSSGFGRNPHKPLPSVNVTSVSHKMMNHPYPKHSQIGASSDTSDLTQFKSAHIPSLCPARNMPSHLHSKGVSKLVKERNSDSMCAQNSTAQGKINYNRPKGGIHKDLGLEEKLMNGVQNAQLDSSSIPCSSHSNPNEIHNTFGQESCLIYDSGEPRIPHPEMYNWDSNQQWQSAPGVDIDQVAASISQKDGSRNKIIKAALEVLHLRKSKPPSSGLDLSEHASGK